MLFFRRVRYPDRMPAVTHADASARVQSVTASSTSRLYELLVAHRASTGIGVLCNTPLSFPGKGFLNRLSEVVHYCDQVALDHLVVDGTWYRRQPETGAPG